MVLTGCLTRRMGLAGPRRAGAVMSWNGMATYGSLAAGAPLGMLLYQKVGQCRLCPYSLWLCVYCHAVVIRQPPGSLWGGAEWQRCHYYWRASDCCYCGQHRTTVWHWPLSPVTRRCSWSQQVVPLRVQWLMQHNESPCTTLKTGSIQGKFIRS